jgi:hypothetical protein
LILKNSPKILGGLSIGKATSGPDAGPASETRIFRIATTFQEGFSHLILLGENYHPIAGTKNLIRIHPAPQTKKAPQSRQQPKHDAPLIIRDATRKQPVIDRTANHAVQRAPVQYSINRVFVGIMKNNVFNLPLPARRTAKRISPGPTRQSPHKGSNPSCLLAPALWIDSAWLTDIE